jgi:hypothetical protein
LRGCDWPLKEGFDLSISDLGSLGEFLSSVAVLATLVVLVVQVRGARAEISSQTRREIKRQNNETWQQLTQDPRILDIHVRAQRDYGALTESEALTWTTWMYMWITQTEDLWMSHQQGLMDARTVDIYLGGIALVLRSSGGNTVWPIVQRFYDPDFVEEVNRTIARENTTWLEALLP